jgi:adenylate kinase
MAANELQRILLVGPPGAGKGSLAPRLEDLLGVPHVSSGQLLRASVATGDPHHIADQVNRGHLVPDRIVAQVMADQLGEGFILDGYPRTVRQAQQLDHHLGERGRQVQLVLELIVPDEVASARLSRRARMESRSDDNPDTVAARLVTYRRDAGPLLAHYAGRVRRVSASGDLDEVFERAERALASLPRAARG